MILYRIQYSQGAEWCTEWYPTLATGKSAFKRAQTSVASLGTLYLDEVEVPVGKADGQSGRENVAEALNSAFLNRESWPGKMIARYAVADDIEDLLS